MGMMGQYFISPFYIYSFQIGENGVVALSSFFVDSLKVVPYRFQKVNIVILSKYEQEVTV